MSPSVVKLDLPYRSVVDLAQGCAVIPKTGERLCGAFEVELAAGDIVLRYADGHAVTLTNL